MSLTTNEMSPADFAAVMGGQNGGNSNSGWGNDWFSWIILFIILSLFGGRGFGGFGGGFGNGAPCATQADVRSAVDQQTLISKIDQQTYGMADSFTALNNTLNSNFRGIDNAICTLGYQNQQGFSNLGFQMAQCCCNIERAIDGNTNAGTINTMNIQRQISDCCCDLEKMNMQNRFDAQGYNCNTLQAIDKLGDRVERRLDAMESARMREQLDAERTKNAVLQGYIDRAQLRYDIVNDVRPCPVPAYITCNPYAASYGGVGYGTCGGGCNGGYGAA